MAEPTADDLFEKSEKVDPDKTFEKSAPEISGGEAFGLGAAQGMTFGFADELAAADTAVKERGLKTLISALKGEGPKKTWGTLTGEGQPSLLDTYRKNRDQIRAQDDAAQEQHPWLHSGGELVGGLVTVPFTGGAGEAAGLARVGRLALQGAKIGAAAGLGHSKSDLTEGDVGGAAVDTVAGAGTGAATGAALGGLGNLAGKVGTKIQSKLDEMIAKSPYLQEQLAALRGMSGPSGVVQYAREIETEELNKLIAQAEAELGVAGRNAIREAMKTGGTTLATVAARKFGVPEWLIPILVEGFQMSSSGRSLLSNPALYRQGMELTRKAAQGIDRFVGKAAGTLQQKAGGSGVGKLLGPYFSGFSPPKTPDELEEEGK